MPQPSPQQPSMQARRQLEARYPMIVVYPDGSDYKILEVTPDAPIDYYKMMIINPFGEEVTQPAENAETTTNPIITDHADRLLPPTNRPGNKAQ